MLLAFALSSVFLTSYIVNHALQGDTIFRNLSLPKSPFSLKLLHLQRRDW